MAGLVGVSNPIRVAEAVLHASVHLADVHHCLREVLVEGHFGQRFVDVTSLRFELVDFLDRSHSRPVVVVA